MKYLLYFPTAVLLFPLSAFAQPTMVDMPWSKDLNLPATAYALQISTTGVYSAVPGMNIPVNLKVVPVFNGSIKVIFPAITSKRTVVAVRLDVCPSSVAMTCEQSLRVRVPLSAPLVVNSGHQLLCQLDANLTQKQGPLNCAVDQLTVSGPITPAPTPIPPVVTPPSPPTQAVSLVGDASPPLTQLIATDGGVWVLTLPSGLVTRNGVDTKNPFGPAPQTLRIYVSPLNTIRVDSQDHGYNCWTGTAWAGGGC